MLGVARGALISTLPFVREAYGQTVLGQDPVSYWHLGEGGGATIVDETATQNGTYQGTIEFGVEPLVLDSLGTSVGFNGTDAFGIIPHHPSFALASYTVDFAFQIDAAPAPGANRVLFSKDRVPSPTGPLSIEVFNSAGQIRLRAYAGGVTPVWIGSSGGVANLALGTAYKVTLTVDATAGAKLYLDGVEVGSAASSTTGLVSNSEPFVIGAYSSSALSKFDGVIDEVALFGRALTAVEIRTLARASSIVHAIGDLSATPPANASVWVAPGGTAPWPGTQAVPMGNIAAALRGSGPGDVIAVLGGLYEESGETISGINGTSGSPIKVIAYGTGPAKIDNSYKQFRGAPFNTLPLSVWSQTDASRQIWISSGVSVSGAPHGFGPVGDGVPAGERLRLATYATNVQFESTSTTTQNGYQGPGLRASGSNVRIRMQTARFSNELGHGNFPTNKNPNQQDIVIFGDATLWVLANCSWIDISHLEWIYCNTCIDHTGTTNNISYRHCRFEGKADYLTFAKNVHHMTVDHCKLHFNMPNYVAHRSWKDSDMQPAYDGKGSLKGPASANMSATAYPHHFTITNNEFFGCLMPLNFWSKCSDMYIANNHFKGTRDDVISFGRSSFNIEFAFNWCEDCHWLMGKVGQLGAQPAPGQNWMHHNVIQMKPFYHHAANAGDTSTEPSNSPAQTAMQTYRMILGHSSASEPFYWKIYYNTIMGHFDQDGAAGIGMEYPEGQPQSADPTDPDQINNLFNNIFVQQSSNHHFIRDAQFHQDNIADGNVYHRPVSQSTVGFSAIRRPNGTTFAAADLAAIKADTAFINGSKGPYSPGFEASGIQTNPNFVGGGSSIYGTYLFGSVAEHIPQAATVKTGAVDITSRGFPGAIVYQAWRGALDPDGDGSEVGIQP